MLLVGEGVSNIVGDDTWSAPGVHYRRDSKIVVNVVNAPMGESAYLT